jgi:hypothetical protein
LEAVWQTSFLNTLWVKSINKYASIVEELHVSARTAWIPFYK